MFKEILLPVDLQHTRLSERSVDIVRNLAEGYDAHVTVVSVIPDFGMPLVASYFPDDAMEEAAREVRAELRRFVEQRFDHPEKITTHVDTGSPHVAVIRYAQRHGTDLIIVPACAMNVSKVLLGSTSTQIVERATCTVMVVRP